jgi:hypothetical protein
LFRLTLALALALDNPLLQLLNSFPKQLLPPGTFVPFTIIDERITEEQMETNLNQRQRNRPKQVSLLDALQSRITRNAKRPSFANRTVGALVYQNPRARKR